MRGMVVEASRRGASALALPSAPTATGIVERRGDSNHAASGDCYLDAMTEYHVLREKGPKPADAG